MSHTQDDWQSLQVIHLQERLTADEFEQFCAAVVASEAYYRHDSPQIDGPSGDFTADGGRDLLLTLCKPPLETKVQYQRQHQLAPLTEDPLPGRTSTRTAYSFKSGATWLQKTLEEIRDRAERPIEVLAEGGYFKIVLNRPGLLDKQTERGPKGQKVKDTPLGHILTALRCRLGSVPPDLASRVEIVDGGILTHYLRNCPHKSLAVQHWTAKLGLTTLLHSLEDWHNYHVQDRQEPQFFGDDAREQLRHSLTTLLDSTPQASEDRVVCIVGKPGVGKTRLVLETLRVNPRLSQRVRAAYSPTEALEALDQNLSTRSPGMLLVIDDCMVEDTRTLATRFRSATRADANARLVLLIPASHDAPRPDLPSNHVWFIEPLDDEHIRQIVASETGLTPQAREVADIARLSEGFPWFARLLAVEYRNEQRAISDMRDAVQRVLASQNEVSSKEERKRTRLRRAQSLLAATLTSRVDWDTLVPEARESLAKAVSLPSWQDLRTSALECVDRGLLRRNLGWQHKYVTPQVLEREIVAWLLGPDGTDPGGRNLARHAKEYLAEFYALIPRFGLDPAIMKGLADVGLRDLIEAPQDFNQFPDAGLPGVRLSFVAHHRPNEAAYELYRRLRRLNADQVRALSVPRRSLVWAFEELARHHDTFESAEEGLFILASAENESFSNNATGVWASLFHVEFNATRRALDERMQVLARRMTSEVAHERLVALRGVESVISEHTIQVIDGPWSRPDVADARAGRVRVWSLLLSLFKDSDPDVRAHARRLAIGQFRSGVRMGLGREVSGMFMLQVPCLSDRERVLLREKLEEVHAYDSAYLPPDDECLTQLTDQLTPRSYRELLRQRVSVWGPASLRGQDDQLDDEVARQGLQGDVPIRKELSWLLSNEAQRAHVFAFALGRCDQAFILFEDLRRFARANPMSWMAQALLARYLGGAVMAGRREHAEFLALALQHDPVDAAPAALALIEVGFSEQSLRWLMTVLRQTRLSGNIVLELARRRTWLDTVAETGFLALVGALVDAEPIEYVTSAVEMIVNRYKKLSGYDDPLRVPLLRALERLAPAIAQGMTDYSWENAATLLIDVGEAGSVARLAVIALQRPHGSNDFAWNTLRRAATRDPERAFLAVVDALDRDGEEHDGNRLLMAFWFHHEPFAWPVDAVLTWVGDDPSRARMAAGIVKLSGSELPPILRALVQRFGPLGPVAREIMARIESTHRAVASLAEHDKLQLERAKVWINDPDARVATFARELAARLERNYEYHSAHEAVLHRRFGT